MVDFAPREFYDNPLNVRSTIQRQLLSNLPLPRTHRHLLRADALVFGAGVSAKILYPPPHLLISTADDAPLIVQVTIDEKFSVLFESDAAVEAEAALLDASEE